MSAKSWRSLKEQLKVVDNEPERTDPHRSCLLRLWSRVVHQIWPGKYVASFTRRQTLQWMQGDVESTMIGQ